ncbi:MAG: hypothetical protein M3Z98_02860 [Candidatus Dormibacteraeota bacterium]|nr:hypothetical protein [Candidatus Dormibacteraeota bacterium]
MSRILRLRERWGQFGFGLASSLVWALPIAAWAGSVDLIPGPGPWVAFWIGAALLLVWVLLLVRLGRVPVSLRHRRYDVRAMSGSERRWNIALAAFGIGLVAFLNGAATVDWGVLAPSLEAGRLGSVALAAGLATFLVVMLFGIAVSWRRSTTAYRRRTAGAAPA